MRCDCVCKATYHALPTPAQIFYCNVGNFPRNFYCCCDRHQAILPWVAWRRANPNSAGAQLTPAHDARISGPRRSKQRYVPALEGQAQHRLPSALRGLGGRQQHKSGTCQLVNRVVHESCAVHSGCVTRPKLPAKSTSSLATAPSSLPSDMAWSCQGRSGCSISVSLLTDNTRWCVCPTAHRTHTHTHASCE